MPLRKLTQSIYSSSELHLKHNANHLRKTSHPIGNNRSPEFQHDLCPIKILNIVYLSAQWQVTLSKANCPALHNFKMVLSFIPELDIDKFDKVSIRNKSCHTRDKVNLKLRL